MFRPGSHVFLGGPGKGQSAKIANEKIHQIWDIWPLLKNEISGPGAFGPDYVRLLYFNGSKFDVITPLNSSRGNRATAGIIDEVRDQVPDDVNNILIPLLNVNRPMANFDYNPNEPQQVQMWISSASDKNTFCYDKTIQLMELAILQPDNVFMWGFDYRIPVQTGLLSRNFLTEQKLDNTFTEEGFAREYMSRFNGSSEDAWFDGEKITKRRILINPEVKEKIRDDVESFYLISVDVAHEKCQSIATVLKVFPKSNYTANLVNLFVLGKTNENKVFDKQAIELKRIIEKFNPKEVVIDINGLGVGLADEMIKEQFDNEERRSYPAYGFFNRDEYESRQPKGCRKILYGLKANNKQNAEMGGGNVNSQMHTILFNKIAAGELNFLISERQAKVKLNSTRVGQKMSPEQKNLRLLPHELTSQLIYEILNLKIKPATTANNIQLELINKRMTKDKFSALEMGTYRIKEMQNAATAKSRNRGLGRAFNFYHKGGGRFK